MSSLFIHAVIRQTTRLAFSSIVGILLVSQSGVVDLARAATCDTANYDGFALAPDGKSTIAVTKQPLIWQGAQDQAKASGGRLVVITDQAQNNALAKLAQYFTPAPSPSSGNKAWIGLWDEFNTAAWCLEGQPCIPMPSRFNWAGGFSSFRNYSTGQPNGYCTNAERAINPDHNCYGEDWVAMSPSGKWSDEGDHGTNPIKLKGLVEWPQQILDCVRVVTPPLQPAVVPMPDADKGALWCSNIDRNNLAQCLDTSVAGQKLCPLDKVACNAVLEQPSCPGSSTLNKDRHMCQQDPVITCPGGGSVIGEQCKEPIRKGCPANYTYVAATDRCEWVPQCPSGGTYNSATNKCEVPATTITQYQQPIVTTTSITKYQQRGLGNTADPANATTTRPSGLDIVRFEFGYSGGQVNLTSECAWGGAGNNGCDQPNWNWKYWGTFLSQSTTNGTLTATAKICEPASYFCQDKVTCAPSGIAPDIVVDTEGMTTCSFSCSDGGVPVVNATCISFAASASLSEFQSCPAGTTPTNPITNSQCSQLYTAWGVALGISDCNQSTTYTCAQSVQACPVGTIQVGNSCQVSNPTCPGGNFEDHGLSGDLCWAPYVPECPDSTYTYNPTTGVCETGASITCPPELPYRPLPVGKCEAIPVCSQGLYNPATNTCFNNQYTCPTGNFTCSRIAGDATEASPGIPMTYCSPNQCQADTTGWTSTYDTQSGLNDKTNDGPRAADGSCLGTIYLFNGNDMRCRQYDRWGMLNSYAKLVGQIALAAMTAGAGLAATLGLSGAMATAISNAAVQIAMNATIDAATGQLNTGTLIQAGTSIFAAGIGASGSTGGWGDRIADAMATVGNSTPALSVLSDPAFSTFVQQMGNLAQQYSPAIQQGMLENYKETHCCYPDTMSGSCEQNEFKEASLAHNGACHIVGSYCAAKLLFTCMTAKQTSCCFSSRLARIFHEQGRPQLNTFKADGDWGSPRSPNCRGFTPTEFQSLDMSAIDLTEYTNELTAKIQNLSPMLQDYMKSVGQSTESLMKGPAQ